jgi:hypothetical protein
VRTYTHRRTGRRIAEPRVTAYHEAGHAIAALALGLPVSHAMIEPARCGNGVEGTVLHGPALDWVEDRTAVHRRSRRAPRLTRRERTQLESDLVVCAAGLAAEQILLGGRPSQNWNGTDDRDQARDVARLLGHHGAALTAYVARARVEAMRILRERWADVRAVARALLRRERVWRWRPLHGRELRLIAHGARGPQCV